MSSGNQTPYNYGDPYRNYQQGQTNEGAAQNRPQESPQGYPAYPPTSHPYAQMYYQHQPSALGQQQQQQHDSSVYTRSGQAIHQPRYPGYNQFIPPMARADWASPPPPPMPNSTYSYSSYNNNNNNNYQNQVPNDWTQYHQQSSWAVGNPNPVESAPYRQQQPPSNNSPENDEGTPYALTSKIPETEPVPSVSEVKIRPEPQPEPTDDPAEEKEEEKETKKPVPIMVGKRRGGRVLPTGVVKKPRTGSITQGRTDAWGQYMAEVRKYKEQSCEEERKNRPLVK